MKHLTRTLLLAGVLLTLFSASAFAQNEVQVTVKDAMGPIPGADIMIKGTTIGAMTNLEGVAVLHAKETDVLVVSFLGYVSQEITVGNRAKIAVTLQIDSEQLDETVVVGYGTQKKASLTSAITNIHSEDIVSTKQADLVSSLQGKVPGLQIRQNSGQVGFFNDDINVRGYGTPLVIIDGVARTSRSTSIYGYNSNGSSGAALAELNPEDIESITVLKDASASIYGIGAQNGVILVTTKKGQIGKPNISYSNVLTFGVPTALPEEVDIVTYMEIENEMRVNHRESPRYSEELINHYRNGDEGYEDFSWYDAIMKKSSFSQVHNVSIRGGNNQTQYYLSGNITDQDAIYRSDTGDYHRYGLVGNFTTKITDNLSLTFQSSINVSDQLNPASNTIMNGTYYAFLADRTYTATVPGTTDHYTDLSMAEHRNPVALMNSEVAGYKKDNDIVFRNNLDIKYEAPFLRGLNFQLSGAYDVQNRQNRTLTLHFPVYDYNTGEISAYNPDNNEISETWNTFIKYYGRAQANYNTTFRHNHHFGAMIGAEFSINQSKNLNALRQYGDFYTHDIISQGDASTATNSGSRSSSASAGYIGRINYDYKGKYLLEVMARYDGTYLYAPGYRWGLFPSYSVGWRISEEPFFKRILPKVNNLKVRWSDGLTGQPQGSPYAYQLGYTTNGTAVFDDGSYLNGYASHSTAETFVSWADVRLMDFGIDLEAWQGIIGGSVDWFWRRTSGIAATASSTVPDFYGISLPQMNLNASENVGIDLTLSHRRTFKDFSYRLALNASFNRFRYTHLKSEETAIYTSANNYYTSHTEGRWSNARSSSMYYWINGGQQFTSWQEISDYPVMYSESNSQNDLLPGMYMIYDRNGDGYITNNDVYYTWPESNPPLQFGLVFSMRYKNLDFNMTWNGASLTNKSVSLSGGTGYGFFRTFYENYMDRWHLADGYTDPFDPQSVWIQGYWPALSTATSAYDTSSNASYRYSQPYTFVDGTYFRLKSLEIGYTMPKLAVLQKLHIRSLRAYVNGTNLLTFCNKLLKPYDPERNTSAWLGVSGTPLMKNFSVGVNVSF